MLKVSVCRKGHGRNLLLVQGEVNLYGASYGAAYHGVVADAEEAHHFYVGGHGA